MENLQKLENRINHLEEYINVNLDINMETINKIVNNLSIVQDTIFGLKCIQFVYAIGFYI